MDNSLFMTPKVNSNLFQLSCVCTGQRTHETRPRNPLLGSGFVFNTVHNIQAGVPAENIIAMYAAAYEASFY